MNDTAAYLADHATGAAAAACALWGVYVSLQNRRELRERKASGLDNKVDSLIEKVEKLEELEERLEELRGGIEQARRNADWIRDRSIEKPEFNTLVARVDKEERRVDKLADAVTGIERSVSRIEASFETSSQLHNLAQVGINDRLAQLTGMLERHLGGKS